MDVGKTNEAARDAWVRTALAALPARSRLLDVGAGEGRYRDACAHLEYVAQDFGRYEGTGDGSGLQTGRWDTSRIQIRSDATAIPLPDRSFDAVLCTEVLEHVPDPVGVLRETARLLAAGGTLLVTAPFFSLTHFSPYYFHTGFSRQFYEHHLPALGFAVEEITPNGNYFEALAQELRRVKSVAETYGAGGRGFLERRAYRRLLAMLARMSGRDRGSSELLCYGLHVRARRT
jgi:ubiquinone/menaquinone biosynthesis C-methylase UbiE